MIREFIANDPNYMWTVQNFEEDLDQGNDTIPGLKKFIEERTATLAIELADLYNCDETSSSLNFNDLVINEFCASCDSLSTISDAAGEYDDWIEIYNNSDAQVDLSNAYLTDDVDKPQKWAFPEGTSINSGAYLIVWADNDEEQNGIELHANFKLSKAGEFLMLMDNNTVLDSLSFGEQNTNLTASRIPNGTGDFLIVLPTFNTRNSETTGIDDLDNRDLKVNIYPNPASGSIFIDLEETPQKGTIVTVFNTVGQNVLQQPIINRKTILPIDLIQSGIYILTIENKEHKVFYNQKMSIY
ncbi:MAG: lamin tail domain-containing protein [Chitinophagales bacterium]